MSPKKPDIKPNPRNKTLGIGAYVEFKTGELSRRRRGKPVQLVEVTDHGTIVNYNSEGVFVSSDRGTLQVLPKRVFPKSSIVKGEEEKGPQGPKPLPAPMVDIIFVPYTNETLKAIERPRRQVLGDVHQQTLSTQTMYAAPVTEQLRQIVVNSYTTALQEITGLKVGEAFVVEKPKAEPTYKFITVPKETWENYYAQELNKWRFPRLLPKLAAKVKPEKIRQLAESEAADMSSIPMIMASLNKLFASGNVLEETDHSVIKKLKNETEISVVHAKILTTLETRKSGGQPEVTGKALAIELSDAISNYFRYHPPAVDVIYRRLFDQAVFVMFNNTQPTDAEMKEFENSHKLELAKLYDDYSKDYDAEFRLYEKAQVEAAKKHQQWVKEEKRRRAGKVLEPTASTEPIDILIKQVQEFEKIVFATHGGTVLDYLSNVALPLIFMERPLGMFSSVFQAKLKSGEYGVSSLYAANMAHFLPEFAMNHEAMANTTEVAVMGDVITKTLLARVDQFIVGLNPLQKWSVRLVKAVDYAHFSNMLVTPQSVCRKDTNTGNRGVITDGKYEVEDLGRGGIHRKIETIPDSDLVICYAPEKTVEEATWNAKKEWYQDKEGYIYDVTRGVPEIMARVEGDGYRRLTDAEVKKLKGEEKKVIVRAAISLKERKGKRVRIVPLVGPPKEKPLRKKGEPEEEEEEVDPLDELIDKNRDLHDATGQESLMRRSGKFSCHSIRDLLRSFARGVMTNPVTGQPFPEKFITKIKTAYSGLLKEPDMTKEIEEGIPVKKVVAPPTTGVREPGVKPPTVVARRRPLVPMAGKAAKKAVKINKIAIIGDELKALVLFDNVVSYGGREIQIVKPEKADVIVVGFDVGLRASTIEADLKKNLAKIKSTTVAPVYAIGINAGATTEKAIVINGPKIKRWAPQLEGVYYALGDADDIDDLVYTLRNVFIDMERVDPGK